MAPGVCNRHVLLMTCLMILTGSGSLAKDWVRGPGSVYPDGWTTTSEVARQCQLLRDRNYDPPSACKEPMSIEDMSDKKKSAGMCMLPFSGGPTVEYEKGTTNVAEWAIIKVSGCVCDSICFSRETYPCCCIVIAALPLGPRWSNGATSQQRYACPIDLHQDMSSVLCIVLPEICL